MTALSLLLTLVREEKRYAAGWAISLLASTLAMLAVPVSVRTVIDGGFSGTNGVSAAFPLLACVALVMALTTSLRLYCVSTLSDRVVGRLRKRLFPKLLARELEFHHEHPSIELVSRLTTDAESLRIFLGASVSIAVRSGLILCGATIMLFASEPKLAVMMLVVVPLAVAPIFFSAYRLRRASREYVDLLARSKAVAAEALSLVRAVKEFGRETHLASLYSESVDATIEGSRRRTIAQSIMTGLTISLIFGAVILVLKVGATMVAANYISPGVLGQFLLYALLAGSSAAELLETWSTFQRSVGSADRIAELWVQAPGDAGDPTLQIEKGSIEFECVDFAYRSRPDSLIIRELSLKIPAGQRVALVGPSGCGKSTLLSLMLRLYKPQRGRILIDGMDLSDLDCKSLRESMAVVPQSPAIFAASVRENIRFGSLKATDRDVENAGCVANADAFIRAFPRGYDEQLGERGVRLSGGQQQRIAIARAAIKNSRILLLDEATSALDALTEKSVSDALLRLTSGKTTIIVAHRLATVKAVDRIIVLDDGKIVGDGTHEALLGSCTSYSKFVRLQLLPEGQNSSLEA